MDVQMPEMDGLDATAAIRAREGASGAHIPIVAMTAHAMEGDRDRCLEAGMDGYVTKPVEADRLVGGRRGRGRDVRSAMPPPQRLGGDRRLLRELLEIFLAECPVHGVERPEGDRCVGRHGAPSRGPCLEGIGGQLRGAAAVRGGAAGSKGWGSTATCRAPMSRSRSWRRR